MNDYTRVNELQDKLLQAMDIINAKALDGISFDRTILCTIEDDSSKKEGKYTVYDGSKSFVVYSSDTSYRTGENVYVTIPEGNIENQKIIIGKKNEDTDKPFVFTMPFDTIFDMTDNVVAGQAKPGGLTANALNKYGRDTYEFVTLYDGACNYCNYTHMGLKANFKSWIKEAIRGDYGLAIILTAQEPDIASSQSVKEQEYYFTFSNKDMYGNSYNFEVNYEQQLIIPLEEVKGTITNIKINFYQEANFFNKFNEPLPCSEKGFKLNNKMEYELDKDGNYIIANDDIVLDSNIFVDNIYLCLGYEISTFTKDLVEIYTQQSTTYKHSNSVENNGIEQNSKIVKLRWVHLIDETPVSITADSDRNLPYEIRWYKYRIGAAAADKYCGVYWTRIENVSDFSYRFNPDTELQQEKIKAIIIYDNNIVYRSNELIFTNEENLPPSQEAYHITNALTITVDDGTNGNYMIYGQDNSIKDTVYAKETRALSLWFDANSNGILEDNERITSADQMEKITWTFPAKNTMLKLVDGIEIKEEDEVVAYSFNGHSPFYTIESYYSSNKTNNTIVCTCELNGRVYKTEKEFTFGPSGTMGTDQTLVIDFLGDTKSVGVVTEDLDAEIGFQVQLYDNQNKLQSIPNGTVTWKWYYNNSTQPVDLSNFKNSVIMLKNSDFNINCLYILEATVGDKLTTYFPIPVQNGNYSYIQGPTQVIYTSGGEPTYNKEPYKLLEGADNWSMEGITWELVISPTFRYIGPVEENNYNNNYYIKEGNNYIKSERWNASDFYYDSNTQETLTQYCGSLSEEYKLKPIPIYVEDAPVYGVQAKQGNTILWTQPILVLQNKWPNNVINKWDGESLVLDEETSTILAAAIAAGKKNAEDNTFSGVMLGDWGDQDAEDVITKQTGVYGFHHGAMSYALKEDGTAFFGKDGKGRINIDGNEATIYGGTWENGKKGMKLSLSYDQNNKLSPYLIMNNSDNNENLEKQAIDYPFQIGNKLKVSWDGTIEAEGIIQATEGAIGNWKISEGNIIGIPYNDTNPTIYIGEPTSSNTIKLFSYYVNNYSTGENMEDYTAKKLYFNIPIVEGLNKEQWEIERKIYPNGHAIPKGRYFIDDGITLFEDYFTYPSYKTWQDVIPSINEQYDKNPEKIYVYKFTGIYETKDGIKYEPNKYYYFISSSGRASLETREKFVRYSKEGEELYQLIEKEPTEPILGPQLFMGKDSVLHGRHLFIDGKITIYDQEQTADTEDGGTYFKNPLGTIGYVERNAGDKNDAAGIGIVRRTQRAKWTGSDETAWKYKSENGVFSIKVTDEHIGLAFKTESNSIGDTPTMFDAFLVINKNGTINMEAENGIFINGHRFDKQ